MDIATEGHPMQRKARHYSRSMIALHWLTALCVGVAWLLSEDGPEVVRHPPVWHFLFGLAVLLLVVPRIGARLAGGAPAPDADSPPLLRLAARIGHGVLYLFLIATPLTGWYAASALGIPVTVFGVTLPALADPVQPPPGFVAELHSTGGSVFLVIAGLHGLMALYHHFVLKDDTLRRMRP
ncbi:MULTISPECIES: cytochrome b [Cupriavidus]